MSDPIERLLSKLSSAKPAGDNKWIAKCPAHEDHKASLSIAKGSDGTALLKCFAGCTAEAVVNALGLTMRDLFSAVDVDTTPKNPRKTGVPSTVNGQTKVFATAEAAVAELEKRHGKRSAMWTYHTAGEAPVGFIVRWNLPGGGKDFRPVSRQGGGWIIGGMKSPRPLYHLPDLMQSQGRVYIAEGEKTVDALRSLSLIATTSAHGAKSAKGTDWKPIAGRETVTLPDNDDAGGKYVEEVISILEKLTPRPIIKLVDLPGLPAHGDAVDFIAARRAAGLDDVAIRAEIEALAEKAEAIKAEEPEQAALQYQPFPVELLPEPVCGYIRASAAAIGCDPAFVGLPLLAALASAIGNSRRIRIKRRWTEPAIIWALAIATSGSHKSPGYDSAMLPTRKRQEKAKRRYAEAMDRFQTETEQYKQKLKEWKNANNGDPKPEEPKEPSWERCWTDDSTIEALASLLLQNPRGLLLASDELSAWFGAFDKYSKSGKSCGDAPKWMHCHGGRPLMIDRKTGEPKTIYVPHATVSVAGGIQPGVLRRTLSREHHENGMAARFLFAMPPKRQKRWTEAEIDEKVEADVLELFDKLFDLKTDRDGDGEPIPRLVNLSTVAKHDVWIPFYNEHGKEQIALDDDLSATWSKLEGYAARLALVHYLVRVAANDATIKDPDTVDEVSMTAGIALSRWFGQEAKRVNAMLAESESDQAGRELLELVERLGGAVTVRDLQRHSRNHQDAQTAEKALQTLVDTKRGTWQARPTSDQGGRPTRQFVLFSVDTTPQKPKEKGGSVNVNDTNKGKEWGEI